MTFIDLDITILSFVTINAFTGIITNPVQTSPVIDARSRQTVVDHTRTVSSSVTMVTYTFVIANQIRAVSMDTGVWGTFIDINFASFTGKTNGTNAGVIVDLNRRNR